MGQGESSASVAVSEASTEPFFDGSRSNLDEVPPEILSEELLERVELQGNKLKSLPKVGLFLCCWVFRFLLHAENLSASMCLFVLLFRATRSGCFD